MAHKINCLAVDDEPVALEILSNHIARIDRLNLVQTCANATEAFNHLSNHRIDLIFLDINMPGITGIAFAKAINPQTKIILQPLTASMPLKVLICKRWIICLNQFLSPDF